MNLNKNIVVFGGTGYYGRHIVRSLLGNGIIPAVISRNAENAYAMFDGQAKIIEGDVTDIQLVRKALKNQEAVIICLSAVKPGLIRRMKEIEYDSVIDIINVAKEYGIDRLVLLSVYTMRMDVLEKLGIPEFGKLKFELEKVVISSGLNWTILGCAPSMELFFAFLRNRKMAVPGGGRKKVPSVAAKDVGIIAAKAAMRNDLAGKRFKLTGTEAYSFPEVAGIISQKTGKSIKHLALPLPLINFASAILLPFYPYVRYLYKSLRLLNNFPEDEADKVPDEYTCLSEAFGHRLQSLNDYISEKIAKHEL